MDDNRQQNFLLPQPPNQAQSFSSLPTSVPMLTIPHSSDHHAHSPSLTPVLFSPDPLWQSSYTPQQSNYNLETSPLMESSVIPNTSRLPSSQIGMRSLQDDNNVLRNQCMHLQHENTALKAQVASLRESYQTLVAVVPQFGSASRTQLDHNAPSALSFSLSSFASMVLSREPLEILKQSDYPLVRFWRQCYWNKHTQASAGVSITVPVPVEGEEPDKDGINNMMKFVEDQNGVVIDGYTAGYIQKAASTIYFALKKHGEAPDKWGQAMPFATNYYEQEIEGKFPMLWLCEMHWKLGSKHDVPAKPKATRGRKGAKMANENPTPTASSIAPPAIVVTDESCVTSTPTTLAPLDTNPIASRNVAAASVSLDTCSNPSITVARSIFDDDDDDDDASSTKKLLSENVISSNPPCSIGARSTATHATEYPMDQVPLRDARAQLNNTPCVPAIGYMPQIVSNGEGVNSLEQMASPEVNACNQRLNSISNGTMSMATSIGVTGPLLSPTNTADNISGGGAPELSPDPPALHTPPANMGSRKNVPSRRDIMIPTDNLCVQDWCREHLNGLKADFSSYWDALKGTALANEYSLKSKQLKAASAKPAA
ncbi:hypothetical protein BDQ17DRAFT_1440062 [Cyathus striatus]|nr:hypothetical protein BDQ17DRAFT_1440062 [Cyathus striatus]